MGRKKFFEGIALALAGLVIPGLGLAACTQLAGNVAPSATPPLPRR
ncbi:MAG: hypothetical protein VKO21_09445 [Candidatus Sericytochromatia bacterium]|nr:hypothetical protein [Candidatus Sericytochromatia bacterium]